MTKQTIVQRAVDVAVSNGWNAGDPPAAVSAKSIRIGVTDYHVLEILYNHAFAKALFGEARRGIQFGECQECYMPTDGYLHNLAEMVLADNIYVYLEANMPEAGDAS